MNQIKKELERVKIKVDKGLYKFENISCPICKRKEGDLLSKKDRYGLPYNQILCKCGLCYLNIRWNQNSYDDFYRKHYYKIYSSNNLQEYFDQEYQQGKKIFSFVRKKLNKKFKILEVGSGAGGILKYFGDKGFLNLTGLELDEKYVEFSNQNGINTINGKIGIIKDKFDLIIYSHVFEHILDLNQEINNIKKIMNKNGLLFIEVPSTIKLEDYYYDRKRFYQNAHTFNFTKESLLNLMNKNNFKELKIDDFVSGIFQYDPEFYKNFNDYGYLVKREIFKNKIRYIFFGIPHILKDQSIDLLKTVLKKLKLFNLLKSIIRGK